MLYFQTDWQFWLSRSYFKLFSKSRCILSCKPDQLLVLSCQAVPEWPSVGRPPCGLKRVSGCRWSVQERVTRPPPSTGGTRAESTRDPLVQRLPPGAGARPSSTSPPCPSPTPESIIASRRTELDNQKDGLKSLVRLAWSDSHLRHNSTRLYGILLYGIYHEGPWLTGILAPFSRPKAGWWRRQTPKDWQRSQGPDHRGAGRHGRPTVYRVR